MSTTEPPVTVEEMPAGQEPREQQPAGGPAESRPAGPPPAGPPPAGPVRRALPWLGLVALLVSAAAGGNLFALRDRLLGSEALEPRAPAASRTATEPAPAATAPRAETLVRSQPWWQSLTTLEGTASTTSRLTVDDGAMQWRVRGVCQSGRLVVTVAGRPKPVLDAPCTGAETPLGYATKTGTMSLAVAADGPWELVVEQQVDVPLVEEPLPSMSAPGTRAVLTGDFYRMDQTGKGTITVYRLADGSHVLRLDDFYVSPNVDLEITFSPLEAPRTTADFMAAPWVKAAPLDITAGALNFVVPAGMDPADYKSVVIWCPLIDSAYAAATLRPA